MTEKMNTYAPTVGELNSKNEEVLALFQGHINDINARLVGPGADQQKLTWRMPQLDKQIKEMYVTNSGASSASSSVLPTQMITENDIKDMIPEGGLKYDNDKPRMDLLDFDAPKVNTLELRSMTSIIGEMVLVIAAVRRL